MMEEIKIFNSNKPLEKTIKWELPNSPDPCMSRGRCLFFGQTDEGHAD